MAEGKAGAASLFLLVRHVPEMECGKVWTPDDKGTRHCLRIINIRHFEDEGQTKIKSRDLALGNDKERVRIRKQAGT